MAGESQQQNFNRSRLVTATVHSREHEQWLNSRMRSARLSVLDIAESPAQGMIPPTTETDVPPSVN